jgi:hypothetical protein
LLCSCNSQNIKHKQKITISGFRRGAGKVFDLLGIDAAFIGSYIRRLRTTYRPIFEGLAVQDLLTSVKKKKTISKSCIETQKGEDLTGFAPLDSSISQLS